MVEVPGSDLPRARPASRMAHLGPLQPRQPATAHPLRLRGRARRRGRRRALGAQRGPREGGRGVAAHATRHSLPLPGRRARPAGCRGARGPGGRPRRPRRLPCTDSVERVGRPRLADRHRLCRVAAVLSGSGGSQPRRPCAATRAPSSICTDACSSSDGAHRRWWSASRPPSSSPRASSATGGPTSIRSAPC